MLAGPDRLEGHAGVDRGDGQVNDKLDLGHGQGGGQVAGVRDAVLGGLGRGAVSVEVGAGQHGDVGEADQVRQVLVADVAAADDRDPDGANVVAHDGFLSDACPRSWLAVKVSAPMFVVIHAAEICVALPVMAGSFLSERTGSLTYARMGVGGGLSRGSREEVVRASWRSKRAQSDSRARRGGSDCPAIWGDAFSEYSGPSLIRPVLATGPAEKMQATATSAAMACCSPQNSC